MYGLAGAKHTPGMPYLSAFDVKEVRQKPKGSAGQRPLRNKESKSRWKDKRNAKDAQESARHR